MYKHNTTSVGVITKRLQCLQVMFNPIRSGLFQTVNDPGGGALKAPPPLQSRKLLCQSSPYHTCEFYQVFLA